MPRRRPRPPHRSPAQPRSPGPAVDAFGVEVVDPTRNVLATVEAAIQRQDDLRLLESQHIREILTLMGDYDDKIRDLEEKLRNQEAARIDAIRAVDVAAVGRAAEVSATQATTLATQVNLAAEAMRNQVAAAAQAAQANLTTALEPIQTAINDLRKAQYEAQGSRFQQTEGRGTNQWAIGIVIGAIGLVIVLIQFFFHFAK